MPKAGGRLLVKLVNGGNSGPGFPVGALAPSSSPGAAAAARRHQRVGGLATLGLSPAY